MKNVYDNKTFFSAYKSMRDEKVNANNLIENPIMKNLLPDLTNKRILDLGCGDGNMDRYFLEKGAIRVVGVDISKNMIELAKKLSKSSRIDYKIMSMEDISEIEDKFDIVYSSLAFHYVKDFDKLINDINKLLKDDGILIFSQESPLMTAITYTNSEQKNKVEIDNKRYYLLSDYAIEGERCKKWNNVFVTKYHRTFASVVSTLIKNKFQILDFKDSYATEYAIKMNEKYVSEKDRPMFLFVKAQKINA